MMQASLDKRKHIAHSFELALVVLVIWHLKRHGVFTPDTCGNFILVATPELTILNTKNIDFLI
jgi:hypothetical protein